MFVNESGGVPVIKAAPQVYALLKCSVIKKTSEMFPDGFFL